jgi:hypothetical protein
MHREAVEDTQEGRLTPARETSSGKPGSDSKIGDPQMYIRQNPSEVSEVGEESRPCRRRLIAVGGLSRSDSAVARKRIIVGLTRI